MLERIFSTAILALLSLGLTACGGGGGSGGGGGTFTGSTGTLNLSVTDAPVDDASRVLVQFTGIAVKPKEGDAVEIPLRGDSQSCRNLLDGIPPAPTPSGEATVRCVDLLAFQGNRRAQLLQGEELEAGEYTWMRLDVDAERGVLDSIIVLNDGSEESLYIPSGEQSGLKLNTPFNIIAGAQHNFVIDFDLRKSLNKPRGFPDYMLKPSLRLVDISDSGTISGSVEASLLTADRCTPNAYAVYVYQGGNAVVGEEGSADAPDASAAVILDPDSGVWGYTAAFLPPGDYTVVFTCEAGNDSSEEPDDGIEFVSSADSPAMVVSGRTSTVDFGPTDG